MTKIKIPYYESSNNPNTEGASYVVIQTDSCPPRVAHVYRDVRKEEVLRLSRVFTPMHIDAAKTLFDFVNRVFNNQIIYASIYFVLVVVFTYFYTAVTFDPKEISKNLQRSGGFIPGIRP